MVAYRVIGGLCGQGLCYIIIEAKGELFGIGIQEAFGNVRHWDGNQPVCFEKLIGWSLARRKRCGRGPGGH